MKTNVVYNIDCLIGMKSIPESSVDAVICDLPYGTTKNKWDVVIPMDALWEQYNRICKENAPIILFTQMPFTIYVAMSNLKRLKYEWIWVKPNGTGFLNANKAPLKAHENILVFYNKPPKYNPQMRSGFAPYVNHRGRCSTNYHPFGDWITESNGDRFPIDVLYYDREPNNIHPTQKPVALVEYLIRTYTNQGDIILDNCIDSGTTAIAAMRNNRQFIGYEINADYYKQAIKRIDIESMQKPLFFDG